MRIAILGAAALLSACCIQPPPAPHLEPATDRAVAYSVDDRAAYAIVLRAITGDNLEIKTKDVDAGVVETEWYGTGDPYHERRVRFLLTVLRGKCTIRPLVEGRDSSYDLGSRRMIAGEWHRLGGVTASETTALDALVARMEQEFKTP